MQSTLTSKGQATIPKEVREHLGIGPGDTVKYFLLPDGRAYMLPVRPIASLRGMLKRAGQKAISVEEMDDAIANHLTDKYKPTKSPAMRKKATRRRA